MKNTLLLLLLTSTYSTFSQNNKLSGIYTEYKRTLWNNEDGSKYTINQKPFEPNLQFEFISDNNAITYIGNKKDEENYTINGDTLIFSIQVGQGDYTRTLYTKYIIIENKSELVLREFKNELDKEYYLKKFYFKKSDNLQQDYLDKNNFEVYTMVEEMPSYPGDKDALKNYIAEEVKKMNIKGNEKVFIKLLISPEGKLENTEILNSPKVEYVEAAMKIVRKLSNFNSGKQNGKAVYVYYNFPVKFN
jgi:hypothetical protein